MPSPSSSLATLRSDLGGSMMAFDLAMDREGYIAHRVMPVFESAVQSGTFGKIPLAQLLQQRDTLRAPGSGYSRGNFTFDPASFACFEHGAEEPIDDRQAQLYREYFDAEKVAAERALHAVMSNYEARVAAAIFNATTWTGASLTTAPTNEWDDAANALPIDDVEAAARKVWANSGLWPNALIINRLVFRNLRNCAQIIARIAASGAGSPTKATDITAQMLAQVFDLEHVIVAGGAQNTAKEGQTAVLSHHWSNEYAMVARVATRPNDIQEPCLGRTIHWGKDGSRIGGTVETYRDEKVRADIVRVRHDVDELVTYVQAGHLLSNITT